MPDSKIHREAETWIRETWLPAHYGGSFRKKRLDLRCGGQFEFDGVSHDGTRAVAIATNGGVRSSGGDATTKLNKIRSDALFLLLAEVRQRTIIFSDQRMFELCELEIQKGRFPAEIEIARAELPPELEARLCQSRAIAAAEVTRVLDALID